MDTSKKKPLPNHSRGLIWLSLDDTDHVVVLVIYVAKLELDESVRDVVFVTALLYLIEACLNIVEKIHDLVKLAFRRLTSLIQRLVGTKDFDRGRCGLVNSFSVGHFKRIHDFCSFLPRKRHTRYLDLQRAAT